MQGYLVYVKIRGKERVIYVPTDKLLQAFLTQKNYLRHESASGVKHHG